ncbi:hypothetical protein ACSW9K_15830 (plasmid) [Clostridium perfringens]|uniref:hypothetical protein n=1 Tax=Clostridium perfringens TaxID=1502 RepID=UPI001CCA91C6|nr:hypothetical protein [Clostridium perfringens]MDK0838686.1 hypothetical protein [Clostridium perfringens]MDV5092371.1 hypothetical protein [Clostridium perfringens]MDV5110316.1 hypothetical protein [Clostridium perfringens]UBK51352.1 hypothetical protein KLF52_15625 [Clostridium perfringens]
MIKDIRLHFIVFLIVLFMLEIIGLILFKELLLPLLFPLIILMIIQAILMIIQAILFIRIRDLK